MYCNSIKLNMESAWRYWNLAPQKLVVLD